MPPVSAASVAQYIANRMDTQYLLSAMMRLAPLFVCPVLLPKKDNNWNKLAVLLQVQTLVSLASKLQPLLLRIYPSRR